ncbi:hypothetical protein [Lactiplantibacillus plajomi]|uniref:Uncharacterized protein n=1 Tax=Lactiplantibacillus plajomi TaxID=1457217 RepID=A0ABV6K0W1_9LACO|nr:hypothetical protein [Lactiplantibacillus plajomi]
MANITNIDYGQAGWDRVANENFKAINADITDTGWIDLTLINGFANQSTIGKTSIRKFGKLVTLRVALTGLSLKSVATRLPSGFSPLQQIPISLRGTEGRTFSLTVTGYGELKFESPADNNFESTDYVGGIVSWMTE